MSVDIDFLGLCGSFAEAVSLRIIFDGTWCGILIHCVGVKLV